MLIHRQQRVKQLTTAQENSRAALHGALRLAFVFALVKLVIHIAGNLWQAHLGWGYFRDEFYYIACGRHLAWGYVDHGPVVAIQARLAETLFGHSLAGLRLPAALAGSARVFLTGLLALRLGGRRSAQSLAMLGVLVAPQYLAIDGFLSMNSFESLFWMTCLLALIGRQTLELPCPPSSRLDPTEEAAAAIPEQLDKAEAGLFSEQAPLGAASRTSSLACWLLFGVAAGIGLLNKPSMAFFLVALGAALLATSSGRALLLCPETLAGVFLLLAISAPNLLWQVHHHWPTLEFLENGRKEGKNTILGPAAFVWGQIMTLNPVTAFLWIPGLAWLFRFRWSRWLGLTYLFFVSGMIAMHAKDYYVTPIYPVLFAAGGVAWEQRRWLPFGTWSAINVKKRAERLFGFPLYQATLVVTGLLILPLVIPVLTPKACLRYLRITHLNGSVTKSEASPTGLFPQFYADRFGWQEEVDEVRRIVDDLPPSDRARLTIMCDNYGEAGALQFLAPTIPRVLSGHNTYWLWGPGEASGEVVLDISADSAEDIHRFYKEVKTVGTMNLSSFQMPFERRKHIYLARERLRGFAAVWPKFKHYI